MMIHIFYKIHMDTATSAMLTVLTSLVKLLATKLNLCNHFILKKYFILLFHNIMLCKKLFCGKNWASSNNSQILISPECSSMLWKSNLGDGLSSNMTLTHCQEFDKTEHFCKELKCITSAAHQTWLSTRAKKYSRTQPKTCMPCLKKHTQQALLLESLNVA